MENMTIYQPADVRVVEVNSYGRSFIDVAWLPAVNKEAFNVKHYDYFSQGTNGWTGPRDSITSKAIKRSKVFDFDLPVVSGDVMYGGSEDKPLCFFIYTSSTAWISLRNFDVESARDFAMRVLTVYASDPLWLDNLSNTGTADFDVIKQNWEKMCE